MNKYFKLTLQILFLPIRIWYYIYTYLRSLGKISYIEIELTGKLDDSPIVSGWLSLFKPSEKKFYLRVFELILLKDFLLLDKSKLFKQLKEILVVINHPHIGWGKAWEVHSLLKKISQKVPISVFLRSGDSLSYFIALGASKIYIPPALDIHLIGLESNALFYSRFLTKFGIKPNFLKVGDYKNAAEKYTRASFSEHSKKQVSEILSDITSELENAVCDSRFKDSKKNILLELQKKAPYTAKEALNRKLIDGIIYYEKLKQQIQHEHGDKQGQSNFLSIRKAVSKAGFKEKKILLVKQKKKIAFLVGEGIIVDSSESNPKTISYSDYKKAIKDIKKAGYDALLIRWNSPGGSALASDLLWFDLMELNSESRAKIEKDIWQSEPSLPKEDPLKIDKAKEKKSVRKEESKDNKKKDIPIYISQSDVAASGGYFLSAVSEKNVYSTPASITGSIGVISGKFNISNFLKKFGVDPASVKTGAESDIFSFFSNFTPAQTKKLTNNMKSMYELFIDRIYKGRNIPVKKIKQLGGGRVYSGKKAQKLGLVDHLGGIDEILHDIRKDLGLSQKDDIMIDFFPKVKASLGQEFKSLPSFVYDLKSLKELSKENTFYLDEELL